jgi:hypothetical protein
MKNEPKYNEIVRSNMVSAKSGLIVQVPANFGRWFNEEVYVLSGLNGSFNVLTLPRYEELKNKFQTILEIPPEKAKTVDSGSIMLQGYKSSISDKGYLKMPLGALPSVEDLIFINKGWDIVIMKSFKACKCDDFDCGKCLLVNCKDPFCGFHPLQKKMSGRKRLLSDKLDLKHKVKLEEEIHKLDMYVKMIEDIEYNLSDYKENGSFKVLGEYFKIKHFPNMYDMYRTSWENLENQLGSIAKAWHEGDLNSAAIAFESDLAHL